MSKKIGIKIMIITLVIAFVGQLSNVINYLDMKKVNDLSLNITDDYFLSMEKLNDVSEDFNQLQKSILMHCIVDNETQINEIEKEISMVKGSIIASIETLKDNSFTERESQAVTDF